MAHRLRILLATALALVFSWAATIASASFHGFQINQVFSNADRTIQFIVLHEILGLDGENFLGGHVLTSTQGGTTQTYTFDKDLPGGMGGPYGMPSPTAHSYVLIATPGFVQLGIVTPDYVIPNGFLPLTNGTLNYAGVDQVPYTALPTDGANAINRNGGIVHNVAINFTGDGGSVTAAPPPPPQAGVAVEYFYDIWGFYFETSLAPEITALDGGAFGGAWKRTGETFKVWPTATSNPAAVPTCRFFSLIYAPKSSHFYTPFASECESLKTGTAWQFESIAFYIQLVDDSGVCPPGTIPLYRAYNNGMGGAGNHRFTTNLTILNQMLAAGWVFEGHGITKASACVPQ